MPIRRMTPGDAPGVAAVHVATMQAIYRGMMPDAFLDALTVADDAAAWPGRMAAWPPGASGWVAQDTAGRIVAIAAGGPDRRDEASDKAELYCLYVRPQAQGRGLGRALVRAVVDDVIAGEGRHLRAWVLTDNAPARRFYERLGAVAGETVAFELAGARLLETAYIWGPGQIATI